MKDIYKFHYGDGVTCENEKLYEDMALKGWLLKKAGGTLSRFEKCSPRKLQYRVEPLPDGEEAREKIISAYKKAGWEQAASTPGSFVFRGGQKRKSPDINYTEEEKKSIAKALSRDGILSYIVALAAFLVIPFSLGSALLLKNWLLMPEVPLMLGALFLKLVYRLGIEGYRKRKTAKAIRGTDDVPHGPKGIPNAQRYAGHVITAFFCVFFFLFIISFTSFRSYNIGEGIEAPVVSLSDMGIEEETEGDVTRIENVAAKVWDVMEKTPDDGEERAWMRANIYQVNNSFIRNRIPSLLIKTAIFDNEKDSYEERETEGMDLALYGKAGIEFIGIKGRNVYYIAMGTADAEKMPNPLEAIGRAEIQE